MLRVRPHCWTRCYATGTLDYLNRQYPYRSVLFFSRPRSVLNPCPLSFWLTLPPARANRYFDTSLGLRDRGRWRNKWNKTYDRVECDRRHGLMPSVTVPLDNCHCPPASLPSSCSLLPRSTLQRSYLLLLGIPSPTRFFIPGLEPSFSANPSHRSPSFFLLQDSLHGFPRLFTVISEHICFLLLVFLFLHFLVVGSVRYRLSWLMLAFDRTLK